MATLFTKIIRVEIPCYKIAENDRFFAFLDIRPLNKGHTLVIVKEEVDYLFDLPDEVLADMVVFAKSVARAIDRAFSPIRTGMIVEGLEVPHAHIHLVPIFDKLNKFSTGRNLEFSKEEMQAVAEAISSQWEEPN